MRWASMCCRISPQHQGTFRIIELFSEALHGADLEPLLPELHSLLPLGACNGYLLKQAGMEYGNSTAA